MERKEVARVKAFIVCVFLYPILSFASNYFTYHYSDQTWFFYDHKIAYFLSFFFSYFLQLIVSIPFIKVSTS